MHAVAVDSSTLSDFFNGEDNKHVRLLEKYIEKESLFLPPTVITELLSYKKLQSAHREEILTLPLLAINENFWIAAGDMRLKIMLQGKKAKLGDALIAQCCMDHAMPLIARDDDFRHFVPFGLKLAK